MMKAASSGWLKVIKSLIPLMSKPNDPNPFRTFQTEEKKWWSTPIHTATFSGRQHTIDRHHREIACLEIIKCLVPFEENVTNFQISITTATVFNCHRIANYLTSIINPQ